MAPTKDQIAQLFNKLSSPETTSEFFDGVDDNVSWWIVGTTPMSGQYDSKQAFINATLEVLNGKVLGGPLAFQTLNIVAGGEMATVEMEAIDATCRNGMPYPMRYCWVVKFGEKGLITEVRAYLDTQLLAEAIAANP